MSHFRIQAGLMEPAFFMGASFWGEKKSRFRPRLAGVVPGGFFAPGFSA